MSTSNLKACRAAYLAILVPSFGVSTVDAMLGHAPFLGVLNAMASREATNGLPVDREILLAKIVGSFAMGQGVKPFPADVCAAILASTLLKTKAA
jgi:hypothetical protein